MVIVCCGEALIDLIPIAIPHSENGFVPSPGGSPYNTAIAIGNLGVPVQFLGRFSTDSFGNHLIWTLREYGVGVDLVVRSEQNTTLAFANLEILDPELYDLDEGRPETVAEPQYVFYTEGTANCSLDAADLPPHLPADTRCILFGSIAMTMEPIATAIETLILREGSRHSANEVPVISFDPNIRPFMIKDHGAYVQRCEQWIAASTIVKISLADFAFIYPHLSPDQALRKILEAPCSRQSPCGNQGPRLAICTLGPKGALALLRRNNGDITEVSAPGLKIPVSDTIGAGDTFHGAFLSWLEINGRMSRSALADLSEADLYDALLFANKAAAIVCSRCGARPPTMEEVQKMQIH